MPCQNCVRARRATSCAYVPDERLELRESTQRSNNGINGRNSDREDAVSAPLGSGPFVSPSNAAASNGFLQVGSTPNREAETLRDRVQQLEQQLEQILDSRKTSANATPGTRPGVPLHTNLDPSSAARSLGEMREVDDPRKVESVHAESADPWRTRPILAKSRYLGGSHWMHGISLVSTFLF